MKYVPLDKRSKKEQKEFYKTQRNTNNFNTGTRTFKDPKHPSRNQRKKDTEAEINDL